MFCTGCDIDAALTDYYARVCPAGEWRYTPLLQVGYQADSESKPVHHIAWKEPVRASVSTVPSPSGADPFLPANARSAFRWLRDSMRLIQFCQRGQHSRKQGAVHGRGIIHDDVLGAACTTVVLHTHSYHMGDGDPPGHVPPQLVALSSLMLMHLPDPRTSMRLQHRHTCWAWILLS